MRVLVVGGTGMLGEPVARRLSADGHAVRILTRRREAAASQFEGAFEVVGGDVRDAGAVARAVDGCDAVHISLDGKGNWDLERRGAEALAAAAARAGAKRISLISGASVCEDNAWFPMIRAKLGAEQAVRACGVPYTILRCTMFMEILPKLVRGNKALVMGTQVNPLHFIAAGDYARMVGTALVSPAAQDRIFFVHGPEALTMDQAMVIYQRLCAPEARVTRIPFFVLGLVSLLPGRWELRHVGLPLMKYFARVEELGCPDEANRILGAPHTTLEGWCQRRCAGGAAPGAPQDGSV